MVVSLATRFEAGSMKSCLFIGKVTFFYSSAKRKSLFILLHFATPENPLESNQQSKKRFKIFFQIKNMRDFEKLSSGQNSSIADGRPIQQFVDIERFTRM